MAIKIGEFEELVLISIQRLGDNAYGVPIRRHLEEAGRDVSIGALYVTLERLQEKGLVTSKAGGATAERGGRTKRYYQLTGEAVASLEEAEAIRMRVRTGNIAGALQPRLV